MPQTIANFISTRTFGEAEIAIVFDSTGIAPIHLTVSEDVWRKAALELADLSEVPSAITTTVIRTGETIIVIDPALEDPDSRLGSRMAARATGWTRSHGLQAALADLGIANDEVTHVIISHAHFDHCLGVTIEVDGVYRPRFSNARYLMAEAEWRSQPDPESEPPAPRESPFGYLNQAEMWPRIRAVEEAGQLDLVVDEHTVTPGVMMLPAPGETPGHYVVRIDSGGQVLFHLADLVHYWFEFEHLDWLVSDALERDAAKMTSTRKRLLPRVAAENALAIYSHAPFPGWGRIADHGAAFRWEAV